MSKRHILIEEGETYISAKEAKKRFGISKSKLNEMVKGKKVREIVKEEHSMPHTFVDKKEVLLHFYSLKDIEREISEN